MPGLVRKLLIVAAADGLVLQPLAHRNQHPASPVKIDYSTHTINPLLDEHSLDASEGREAFEAQGIIGFLNVFTYSYLIAIAQKRQVAQLWGKPVFVITDVAFIPLQSHSEANQAIQKAAEIARSHDQADHGDHAASDLVEDADNDSLTSLEDTWLDDEMIKDSARAPSRNKAPGIAEGVIGRKGLYGRFAEQWFSKQGWTTGQRRNLGLSGPEKSQAPATEGTQQRRKSSSLHASPAILPLRESNKLPAPLPAEMLDAELNDSEAHTRRVTMSLLPKLLQTTKLLLLSRTFYFSYDFDISRRLSAQGPASSDVALHRQFDSQYFWNRHLTQPLINGGYDELVMPIMQGFIGQRAFVLGQATGTDATHQTTDVVGTSDATQQSVDDTLNMAKKSGYQDFLLTLISRRTTNRAGFRYLRRGVDEDGNVANGVETEQLLSTSHWEGGNVQSFVQTRGSMPLFFLQTPYTFKPLPTLHESSEANKRAMKKHFGNLSATYGDVQAVSLIDKHGVEAKIGNAFENYVIKVNEDAGTGNNQLVRFNWFDFHNICRGMKFENVSVLIGELESVLTSNGWTTMDASTKLTSQQSGIIRTNCMDCLDRTNVVQSAIALHTLQQQLSAALGNGNGSDEQSLPNDSISAAFNALWADNGDAVSLSYAGTAALKGDYVRTRKRTAFGLLSDLSLTLSRYYRNLFDDFFAQAALDYLLGNVSTAVFVEFQERMTTADPAVDLARARQAAVSTAANIIVEEHEDLLAGWAVAAPAASSLDSALASEPPTATASLPKGKATPAALRAQPFREVLILLSDHALYAVAYDWDAEKPRGYERIDLNTIKRIQWGTYITETNTTGQTDATRNVGLRVDFDATERQPTLRRMNTRTIGDPTTIPQETETPGQNRTPLATPADLASGEQRVLAFKVLPRQASIIRPSGPTNATSQGERDLMRQICEEIQKALRRPLSTVPGKSTSADEAEAVPVKGQELAVEEKDIVSLDEARRSTTYAESIGYGLKKLVWG